MLINGVADKQQAVTPRVWDDTKRLDAEDAEGAGKTKIKGEKRMLNPNYS